MIKAVLYSQMKYKIDSNLKKPAYLQLYEEIKKDIINGSIPFGSKLPSKRILSEETGLSVITVEHAYSLLCDEGYVESRERSGYFSVYRAEESFVQSDNSSYDTPITTDSKVYVRQDFPFSVISKTMRKILSDYQEKIMVKSPNKGCIEQRMAISKYLERSRGILASPEEIIIGSGAEYLYGLITEMMPEDSVYGIENPSYEKIEQVYLSRGVKYEMLSLGSEGIKSRDLLNTKANILHLTPFRSFPSGVTATASKRREYISWLKSDGRRCIIEDDFESEFTLSKKPEDTLYSLSNGENVIYLNTFSITISPSIRTGYMVLPKKLLSLFEEKVGFYSCTVPTFEQYVLAEMIQSGEFERHINRVRRKKRKEIAENNG